ncbi:MAG: hypothetical protein GY868_03280, partial [Deltaproteobacteria bacterium]|nr:hypothetical protein [Deltaproteobacteria bacterium]
TMHFLSLASLGLLARECSDCRPFHSGSSGCLVGEGAVILVLEEKGRALKRGARIYAEIAGYAACFNAAADMFSSGSVCPDGDGLELCIRRALADAGCAADEIAYISSDAKGIAVQDRTEAGVLNRLFCEHGRRVPVGMTKALTGHMLPASGAFNALNAVLSVHHGCVPPSGGAAGSDMCGGLSVSEASQQLAVPCALSHTFGLSGEHTALVIKENTI